MIVLKNRTPIGWIHADFLAPAQVRKSSSVDPLLGFDKQNPHPASPILGEGQITRQFYDCTPDATCATTRAADSPLPTLGRASSLSE